MKEYIYKNLCLPRKEQKEEGRRIGCTYLLIALESYPLYSSSLAKVALASDVLLRNFKAFPLLL